MTLTLAAALPGLAQTTAVDFTGGSIQTPTQNSMRGWTFTVNSTITLTDLGIFDSGGDGLVTSHQVGIWNSSGALLKSATVTNASTAVASTSANGVWLFQSVAPIDLGVGTYTIGAYYPLTPQDPFYRQATISNSSNVTYGSGLVQNTSSFIRPTGAVGGGQYMGPNFRYTVPEPSEWAAMGVFGLALGGLVARKRRAA